MVQIRDWNSVVEAKPVGYVELNDGKTLLHGPVESVTVVDGIVYITVKWLAKMALDPLFGTPAECWTAVSSRPIVVERFRNFTRPFTMESSNKGPCVRWGGTNIIYCNDIRGLNPKNIKGFYSEKK